MTIIATFSHRRRAAPACLALLACAASFGALAQSGGHDRAKPLSILFGYETVTLPGNEHMGLVGGSLLFEAAPGWWFGPGVYGAASGERGGLFVGGAELQRRWRFGGTQLVAGFYAGGGGGAAAPVGGGLMLRPALTLLQDLGPLQAGLSWSHVRFPSGDIGSSQLGLVLAWDGVFRYADASRAGETVSDTQRSGVGVDQVVGTLAAYDLQYGTAPDRRIGLVGGRLERRGADGHFYWGLEAAGAASGDAAGYMEILGSAGWDTPLFAGLRGGVRGALGLGGGGAVPTGGGAIAKAALTLSARLSPTWSTGVEVGQMWGLDTSLKAPMAQWWLAAALEPPRDGGGMATGRLQRTEWTLALQHYVDAQRRDGTSASLDTIGMKLTRYSGDHLYLTGQAHSAYAGGAGAYSIGLVGAGLASAPPQRGWQFGAEALVGASGGGGIDTSGGALMQGLAWAGWTSGSWGQWRVGLGALRSLKGNLSTPLLELAWTWPLAQSAP